MAEQKNGSTTVTTIAFRASYPNLFKPRKNDLNGKDEYSVVALFPKGADLSAIKKAIIAAGVKKFGADQKKWPKPFKTPLRDQAERGKEDEETGKIVMPDGYEAGAFFLNLKSTVAPGVVDAQLQAIIDESEIYPGVWLRANINAFAYDQKGNRGVSFGLNHIQKVKDGESFAGGRGRAQDAFSAIESEDGESAESSDSMFT